MKGKKNSNPRFLENTFYLHLKKNVILYFYHTDLMNVLSKVLAESEQMRREADDIGPRAELEHWKKRMSKFNYLVDQIKGHDVKAVLGILHTAKSKLIKVKLDEDESLWSLILASRIAYPLFFKN